MTKNVELNADTVTLLESQLATANGINETLTASLVDMQATYDTTKEQLEVLKVELAEFKQAKEQLELTARLEKRTAKLESALGVDNEQVAKLLATTESLSDEQFDVIAESFGTKQEATQLAIGAELGGEGQESVKQVSLSEKIAQKAKQMNNKA